MLNIQECKTPTHFSHKILIFHLFTHFFKNNFGRHTKGLFKLIESNNISLFFSEFLMKSIIHYLFEYFTYY